MSIMYRKENNQPVATYDVYVGNVPKIMSEINVRQIFTKYGEVKQVLCRWKEDYFGYGIVKFVFKQDADRVLREAKEVSWNGHTMPVKMARRSDQNNQNGEYIEPPKMPMNPYVDANKNQITASPKYSNTDYGYFQAPPYMEEQPLRKLEVLCTNVEDAITFYGCPSNRSEEFAFVISALQNLQNNHVKTDRKIVTKKVYAAKFSEDNSWYRCIVQQSSLPNKPGMCSVHYIDYGNVEDISYGSIIEIPDSLQKIPPFATKFVFANMVCETKTVPKVKSYLHQFVNKHLFVCAFPVYSSHEFSVVKCTFNGKDIIAETVNKNFAKPVRCSQKREPQIYESNSRPKAYSSGTEIRLLPREHDAGFPSLTNVSKLPPEAQNSLNGKRVRKNGGKPKEGNVKTEIVTCNGNHREKKKENDFHPKIIMKRGSEISDLFGNVSTRNPSISSPKGNATSVCQVQPQQHSLALIDTVIPNLKLINNIRGLVSQSSDDSIINNAVELLRSEIKTSIVADGATQMLEEAHQDYQNTLKAIASCSDKTSLSELKKSRDTSRNALTEKLKEYLNSCDNTIFEKKEKIQKTITDLESNSNAWMNVRMNQKPASLDDFIIEYKKVKEERWNLVSKTRKLTNETHKHFMDMLCTLQNEFHLNTSSDFSQESKLSPAAQAIDTPTLYSDKFNESLKELGKAVETEIQTLTLNKDIGCVSVIQWLLEILDVHKEKIDVLCELYESRFALFQELTKLPDIEATLKDYVLAREEAYVIFNKILSIDPAAMTKEPALSLRKGLHAAILKEDYLKVILSNSSQTHFPEINIEFPELKLTDFSSNNFLLKNWQPDYFLVLDSIKSDGHFSYFSQLHEESVIIKEYTFEKPEEIERFIRKAVLWNEAKSDALVKIRALFFKDSRTVCTMLPPLTNRLLQNSVIPAPFEGEKSCRFLRNVLVGLRDIHSQGLVLNTVHPSTVLLDNEKAILDFCLDPSDSAGQTTLKGINFQPPGNKALHESADMYGFGCLVLWILFPNLLFTSSTNGVPNVAAFRSIIEQLMLPKDYSLLSSLVDVNAERRPSASTLLNKGFLSKYEAFCRSRVDAQKSA